ncbi:PLP-dependent aminotransferase family protein [Nocardioides sp. SOB77]|uniref:PLP-dependent aminotransferase family protein n=1 Tax=Nocardioides oceani TaxID=3058369 RepID=A0ABT8FJ06_9ACTN|nr:PLP-dependent aminotransferase family protein [Nocardioides oceani]MDN4174377.1 PLP-dependent aminotransferase family protein [Nocardioides oceani]
MADDSSGRIAADLRSWVRSAAPGARLPSTRELVARHHASPVTVQGALRALVAEGLVESRPGVGTFVRPRVVTRPVDYGWQTAALRGGREPAPGPGPLRVAGADVVALHSGYPDPDLLPQRLVRAALARASRGEASVARPPAAGLSGLRTWFAQELAAATPVGVAPVTARDVVVVPGTQSGLGSVLRALVGQGRPLVVESPTYWGAILAARQTGVRLVPVPSGPDGPDPEQVARALAETGARAFYAQPTYANPTGAQWSPATARAVLDVVREAGAFLVEDDWAHDLGITTTPTPVAAHDDAGHVVHLRSLTKSVSTALRVGAVVARGPARDRVAADQAAESMYVSAVLQSAALEVVSHPGRARHLRQLREQLRSRRDLLVSALAEHAPHVHVPHVPAGGLALWARLPDGTELRRLVERCERDGLLLAGGDEWFPAEPAGPFLRLGFAGPDPASFPAAARTLEAAVVEVGQG